jgi:hypothetical protein
MKDGDTITSSYSCCTSCGSHSNKTLPSASASQSCPFSVSSLALKSIVWYLSKHAGHILFFFLLGIFSLLVHSKPTMGFRIYSLSQCVHTISFHSLQTWLPCDLSSNSLSLSKRNEHIYRIKPIIFPDVSTINDHPHGQTCVLTYAVYLHTLNAWHKIQVKSTIQPVHQLCKELQFLCIAKCQFSLYYKELCHPVGKKATLFSYY